MRLVTAAGDELTMVDHIRTTVSIQCHSMVLGVVLEQGELTLSSSIITLACNNARR